MPTIPERLATLETKVAVIETNTTETKGDVKLLLAWRNEERGAKAQRALSMKQLGTGLTILTIVINIVFRVF